MQLGVLQVDLVKPDDQSGFAQWVAFLLLLEQSTLTRGQLKSSGQASTTYRSVGATQTRTAT